VLVEALRRIGAATLDLHAVTDVDVLGHGVPVGVVRAVF
jgi:hypothetical protein